MGTYYRSLVLEYMGIKPEGNGILDVGCYDGFFLSKSKSKLKIGIDLKPVISNYVEMVAADAIHLPFRIQFEKIFAFDVIEHVEEDEKFLLSLINKLSFEGKLILSTPSNEFRIFPGFLTSWLSKKWGHVRIGYSKYDIKKMLAQKNVNINVKYWNAPFYRFFYFPLRMLWKITPRFSRIFVSTIAKLDSNFSNGLNGYIFVHMEKLPK